MSSAWGVAPETKMDRSHEIAIVKAVIIITCHIGHTSSHVSSRGESRLCLGRFRLLASLILHLLLFHLFVAQRRHLASDFPDLGGGEILADVLDEAGYPERVVRP